MLYRCCIRLCSRGDRPTVKHRLDIKHYNTTQQNRFLVELFFIFFAESVDNFKKVPGHSVKSARIRKKNTQQQQQTRKIT